MSNPINPTGGSTPPSSTSAPGSPTAPNVGKLDSSWANIELADAGVSAPQTLKEHASVGQFSESQKSQNPSALARQVAPDNQTVTTAAHNANPIGRFFRAVVDVLRRCFTRQAAQTTPAAAPESMANRHLQRMATKQPTAMEGMMETAMQEPAKMSTMRTLCNVDSMLRGSQAIEPTIKNLKTMSKEEVVSNLRTNNMFRRITTSMASMRKVAPGEIKQFFAKNYPELSKNRQSYLEGNVEALGRMIDTLNVAKYDSNDPKSTLRAMGDSTNNPYIERSESGKFTKGGDNSEDKKMRDWATKGLELSQQAAGMISDSITGTEIDTVTITYLNDEILAYANDPRTEGPV